MSEQTQPPAPQWPHSLAHKALLALALMALLLIGQMLAMQTIQQRTKYVVAGIGLANTMQQVNQRLALQALLLPSPSGSHSRNVLAPDSVTSSPNQALLESQAQYHTQFEQAYANLHDGAEIYGLGSPLAISHLQAIYSQWQQYQALLSSGVSEDIVKASLYLEKLIDELSQHLITYANNIQQQMMLVGSALIVISFFLIGLYYYFFYHHLIYKLKSILDGSKNIVQGSYRAISPIVVKNEIGLLDSALFNTSSQIKNFIDGMNVEKNSYEKMKAMFGGLAANQIIGIYMLNNNMEIVYANQQFSKMMGYPQELFSQGFSLSRIFLPNSYPKIEQRVRARLAGEVHSERYEEKAVRADGSLFDVEVFGSVMHHQGHSAIIGMMIDISERKQAEAATLRAALIFEHASEAMVITNPKGVALAVNPSFVKITGYRPEEIIGHKLSKISSGKHDKEFYAELWDSLKVKGTWYGDIHNRRKDGSAYIEHLTITTSYNHDGSVNSYIGLFSDVTELRRQEHTIWQQAHYDQLTQLPNRQMFQKNLLSSLEQGREKSQAFALVFLDLDFFKEVNDTFGHDEGDILLCQVARRLQNCIRPQDMVARLGGDEFTLILHQMTNAEDIYPLCTKILQAVAQPYHLSNHSVHISVSAGVTFYPSYGQDETTLLKQADLAMYAAKNKGRNQYCLFDPSMEQEMQNRRLLLRDLQLGLERQEFELHYQPIVQMQTRRTVKAEALIRWNQPVRGRVGPDTFIPLAEESGLIVPMGDWIFTTAAQQLAQWRSTLAPDFCLSINVSPIQLHSTELNHQRWLATMSELGLPGQSLILEITERVLLESDQLSNSKLNALLASGIELALDDFGAGYSSLSYLKHLELDIIKIDRSFVSHLSRDSEDYVLCRAIIVMAHQLGLKVVAEGVESQTQHQLLLEAGCDFGQGYWYSKPLTAQDLGQRLQQEQQQLLDDDKNQIVFDI